MAQEDLKDKAVGLGDRPQNEWPGVDSRVVDKPAIDRLEPNSDVHARVLEYLKSRIEFSEEKMADFYPRWRVNERKIQAYIDLPDWEQELQRQNDKGEPPKVTQITIPYSFATISTMVTFLLHTFTGRKPMFQVGTYKDESAESARKMETLLQYNADHTRLIKHLYRFLEDSQVYGVGILRTLWKDVRKNRTVWRTRSQFNLFGVSLGSEKVKEKEERLVYQGNEVVAQDPYLFFPDPRVAMHDVNKHGEYVFWRTFEGRHELKRQEAEGVYQWVDNASTRIPANFGGTPDSARNLRSRGEDFPGREFSTGFRNTQSFVQVDQGSVEIIPKELGLGESESPEKWLFTIANKSQIIQAEPLNMDHDMHPVAVTEPYSMGHGFGSMGLADYIGPLQDTITWLINSHMDNVRKVLNDMLIVDPSKVEMQDLRNPEAGRLIRLKRAAFGQDVDEAVKQLPVQDVTRQHINDAELMIRLGQMLSGVTDNVLGLQSEGGRKTATEVRTSGEAAASRLAAMARIISAQAMVDLTEQMAVNLQQFLTEDFYLAVVGADGLETPIHIRPEHVVGDFYYPIHDGTLPLDRVAMLDIWRQLFSVVQGDPALRERYSLPRMFEFVAELGGARSIESMRVSLESDESIRQRLQAGQIQGASGGGAGGAAPTQQTNPGAEQQSPSGNVNAQNTQPQNSGQAPGSIPEALVGNQQG